MRSDDNDDLREKIKAVAIQGVAAILEQGRGLSRADLTTVIDEAIHDLVAELNDAINGAGSHGFDAATYFDRYNALWRAKRALD